MLAELPDELVEQVLLSLDFKSLVRCRETCHRINHCFLNSLRLQYRLELMGDGLEEGLFPNPSHSITDRLQMLRSRRQAWKEGKFNFNKDVLIHGVYWGLYGGVLCQMDMDGRFEALQLPSKYREIEERFWVLEDLPIDGFLSVTIDPTEDLLVLVKDDSIDVLSLETGGAHPLAQTPSIPFGEDMDVWNVLEVLTNGEHLSIPVDGAQDGHAIFRLFVYNWRTGDLVLDIKGDNVPIGSAFFLDRYILIVRPFFRTPALAVIDLQSQLSSDCEIASTSDDGSDEEVVEGEGNGETKETNENSSQEQPPEQTRNRTKVTSKWLGDVSFEFQLCFPAPNKEVGPFIPQRACIRSDPSSSWKPKASANMPFHKAQDERLFVIVLQYRGGHGYHAMVPSTTIMKWVNVARGKLKNHFFDWKEWGREGCRFTKSAFPVETHWEGFVYGTSFVYIPKMPDTDPAKYVEIEVQDYGQLAARRSLGLCGAGEGPGEGEDLFHLGTESYGEGKGRYWVSSGFVPDQSLAAMFEDSLESVLPVQHTRMVLPLGEGRMGFSSVMISEDSIILVYDDPTDHAWHYQVISF